MDTNISNIQDIKELKKIIEEKDSQIKVKDITIEELRSSYIRVKRENESLIAKIKNNS